MLDALAAPVLIEPEMHIRRKLRPRRWIRRAAGWLLLAGWIALPVLPAVGLGVSALLGIGLF